MTLSPNGLFFVGLALAVGGPAAGAYFQRLSSLRQQEQTAASAAASKTATDKVMLEKFDELKAMLKKASEAPPGPEQQQQIVNISKEFKSWATFFDANQPELARSIDQSRAELAAKRLAEIKGPLQFYGNLVIDLRQTVAAYNATIVGRPPLHFELPQLEPSALGDPLLTGGAGWVGKISFSRTTYWQLAIQQSSPGNYTFFASDRFFNGTSEIQRGDLQINFRGQSWSTNSFGSYFDPFPKTKLTFDASDRGALREVLQKWFQTQVLLTDKEPRP